MNIVNKNLRKIRAVKSLSQNAFGELVGISRHNIGAYEEGRSQPKVEVVIRIAKIFSISMELLMTKELTVNEILGYSGAENTIPSSVKKVENYSKEDVLTSINEIEKQLQVLKTWLANNTE
jgi:DNA-binding XRE family transcriptional regulator